MLNASIIISHDSQIIHEHVHIINSAANWNDTKKICMAPTQGCKLLKCFIQFTIQDTI